MSEHQIVAFRAVDGPVSEKNLEYMERQSSRAEVTPWSFDNEYHYGDFRGNAVEMLRRGYDVHLHYADFGIRKLMIRLPQGFPDPQAAKAYLEEDSLDFKKDKQGSGGILSISPFHEPGDLEGLWETDDILQRLLPLRAEILAGDLRPLYLAHLAVCSDGNHDPDEEHEGPVPAGLNELSDAQQALAELYDLSDALIAVAAQDTPPAPPPADLQHEYAKWLNSQSDATKNNWLAEIMAELSARVRTEMLTEFRKSRDVSSWPTVVCNRTIAELQAAEVEAQKSLDRQAAEKAARQRAKRLKELVADPGPTLRETESLVKQGSGVAYKKAATLLAELRDALTGSKQSQLAEKHAETLQKKNPTLKLLVSELRKQGFVPKR